MTTLVRVCGWNFPLHTEFMNTPLYLPLKGVHGCKNNMIWMKKIQFEQDQAARRGLIRCYAKMPGECLKGTKIQYKIK